MVPRVVGSNPIAHPRNIFDKFCFFVILTLLFSGRMLFDKKTIIKGLFTGMLSSVLLLSSPTLANAPGYSESVTDQKIAGFEVNIHSTTKTDAKDAVRTGDQCQSLVYEALTRLPQEHVEGLEDLALSFSGEGRRAYATSDYINLRCDSMEDQELTAVFIHEMGHIADGSYLIGNKSSGKSGFVDLGKDVYIDDPSLEFYEISWEDDKNWQEDTEKNDFCSAYGSSDPYEDFAECYLYYVLHREEFLVRSRQNPEIRKKYFFMRDQVFDKKMYSLDNSVDYFDVKQEYDATKLAYDYKAFLSQ